MNKVVLAGGTGFVGRYFEQKYSKLGYEVVIISRQAGHVAWDDEEAILAAVNGSECVINLAGKSVNCRYNEKNKREILVSRTETTKRLGEAIAKCDMPPPLWINSSTATIYRNAEDRPMTEADGDIGEGFSVDVAKAWEKEFFSFQLPHTRQAALRISIVLGSKGGVMTPYNILAKLGLGGRQGSGEQMFSWIHIDDLFRIVRYIQEHEDLHGAINCASPSPIPNATLMKEIRKSLNRKLGMPTPSWMLEIGARIIQTETELILKSRWVIPEKLEQSDFTFKYPTIDKALQQIQGREGLI